MIIFYNKSNGNIVGSINGTRHLKEELNFWVGDAASTERILYDVSAPYFNEYSKDPLACNKFKINLFTLEIEPKV